MGEYIPPSAFYTFDPIRYEPVFLIEPILSSIGGDHKEIKKIVQYSNEIKNLIPPLGYDNSFKMSQNTFFAEFGRDLQNKSFFNFKNGYSLFKVIFAGQWY